MDQSLLLLPQAIRPEQLLGFYIPGIGALLTLLVVLLTGLVTANIVGQRLVRFWEGAAVAHSGGEVDLLQRQAGQRHAVLRQRRSLPQGAAGALPASRGLVGRLPDRHAARAKSPSTAATNMVSVFIPTTPSPVNGFFFFVSKSDTIELDMSVDDALKYIVSMGVVAPPPRDPNLSAAPRTNNPARAPSAGTHSRTRNQPCVPITAANSTPATSTRSSPFAAGPIAAATTAASSSSTCATAKAWPRSSAIPTAPEMFARRRSRAQRIRAQDHRQGAPPSGRHREPQPAVGRDRDPLPRTGNPQRRGHAALPARRREPLRERAPGQSRHRPAPAADAEEHDAALQDGACPSAASSTPTASSTSKRRC